MSTKINLADIRLHQLNSASLIQITKFAHTLKNRKGKMLCIHDEDIVAQISHEAKNARSSELLDIYNDLKSAIKAHINSDNFSAEHITSVCEIEDTKRSINSR